MTTLESPPAYLAQKCVDLVLGQRQALLSALANLHAEFDGVLDADTIERHLHAAYARLCVHGAVPKFLPSLAERSARMVLREQARGHAPGTGL